MPHAGSPADRKRTVSGGAGRVSPRPAPPDLLRLGPRLTEALHEIIDFTRRATGIEPTQAEIAAALASYFTLEEMANQLAYQRRRPTEPAGEREARTSFVPRLRINLGQAPPPNCLARAGFFRREVAEGILAIRRHAAAVLGAPPGEGPIAAALKSSFIVSEIKNQIVHLRSRRG